MAVVSALILCGACSPEGAAPLGPRSRSGDLTALLAAPDAHYRYAGGYIDLVVNPSELVVETLESDPTSALRAIESAAALNSVQHERLSAIRDHWRIKLPMGTARQAASDLQDRILSDARFRFVSPMWLTREGAPVAVTRTIAVRFRLGTSATQIESLVRKYQLSLRRRPSADSGFTEYLFRVAANRGETVLDAADSLATSTLVEFADVEKII